MTTLIEGGEELHQPVLKIEEIAAHLDRFSKRGDRLLFGTEYERLGVYRESGLAVPFTGGIERILDRVAEMDGWERGLENGRIVYLRKGVEAITLEPGGQTEYSSAPAATMADLLANAKRVGILLNRAAEEIGAVFLGIGYHPFSSVDEIGWVPKARYRMMAPYLERRGRLAHEMMKMTAGCQVALDYTSLDDAMRKVRAAALCTPVAQALFASSGVGGGRPLDHICWRGRIWMDTDVARCNIPAFMLRPGADIMEYIEWVLDMPLMFLERKGVYREGRGETLRSEMRSGGVTYYDVELAMTQAFPEVRLKRFVEVRSLDAPQPWLMTTVPCFWSSLLYGDLDGIFGLFGGLTGAQFAEMRAAAIREGLKGTAAGRSMAEWAGDLLALASRTSTCEWSMERLKERIERRETPADGARNLLRRCATPAEFVERWNNEGK